MCPKHRALNSTSEVEVLTLSSVFCLKRFNHSLLKFELFFKDKITNSNARGRKDHVLGLYEFGNLVSTKVTPLKLFNRLHQEAKGEGFNLALTVPIHK